MAKKEETALAFPNNVELSQAIAKISEGKQQPVIRLFKSMKFVPKGSRGVSDNRWRPITINMRQPTTRKAPDAANPGDLFSLDTGLVYEQPLRFVALCEYTTRVKFTTGSNIPTCSSEDGAIARNGDICARCSDQDFGPNSEAPRCTESTNIIATTPEFDKIFVIPFKGKSKKPGDEIQLQAQKSHEEYYESVRELKTERDENKQGVYYVLKQEIVGKTDPEFFPLADRLQDEILAQHDKQIAEYQQNIKESKQRVESISDDVSEAQVDGAAADFSDL